MELEFHKYHGTGNDFIMIDGRTVRLATDPALIARLCDRRFGIGADGLIILEPAGDFDFRMIYFNSDGKESTMCGNGGRCIVAFADFLSLIREKALFMAEDGMHEGLILSKKGDSYRVKIRMKDVDNIGLREGDYMLDTGSPHLVRFANGIDMFDILAMARPLRYHSDFAPSGINVNFVEELQDFTLKIRSYERGVEDETLSCGTGVTASALAYAQKKDMDSGSIDVLARGGTLRVSFTRRSSGHFTDIWLEGPAVRVYSGVLSAEC